jgi:hypothetical protein
MVSIGYFEDIQRGIEEGIRRISKRYSKYRDYKFYKILKYKNNISCKIKNEYIILFFLDILEIY